MKRLVVCVTCAAFLLCAGGVFFLSVCGAQAAKDRGKINLVYIGPLTGSAAAYGDETYSGFQVGAADINAAGGVKVGGKVYDFQTFPFDSEESPEKSVIKMNESVSLHHPLAILAAGSIMAMPLKAFAEQKHFLLLGSSEVPGFTEPGKPLFIRIWLKVTDQGPMLDYLKKLGVNKIGLLAHSGEVSVKWADVCADMWKKKGGTVVGSVTYPVDSTDFTSPVTKLLSYNPEAIASGGNPDARAANLLKVARELGFKGKVFFGGACRGPRLVKLIGKDLAEGLVLVGTSYEEGGPRIDALKKRLATMYPGKPFGPLFSYNYEAAYLLKAGIEAAQTITDLPKIAKAMETAYGPKISPFGVFERVINSEAQYKLHTMEIRNGDTVPIK